MYPSPFEYYRAETVAEALELLEDHADDEVEILAGGHSLLPTMKSGLAAPDVLVDIGGIDDLRGIGANGDATTIGALTRYADVARDDDVNAAIPAVAAAAGEIGDIQVRNRGTFGGNIAHSDPASDLPAAVLAADATIHAEGPDGERTVAADDFFQGMYTTALDEGELLTAVELPSHDVGVYRKKPSPSSGYAMVGVAAVLETDGDTVTSARVAANGATDHAQRLGPVEAELEGATLDADTAEAAGAVAADDIDEFEFMDDLQASAEFRAQLLRVYTQRALEDAADAATA